MKKEITVYGSVVDNETRCRHYNSEMDIVAMKFACCREYYACYFCHQQSVGHPAERWPADKFDDKAILCGKCKSEMSIEEYMSSKNCPVCESLFNPGCALHYHLYFETEPRKSDL